MQNKLSPELNRAIEENRLSHAYLFSDLDMAKDFEKALGAALVDTYHLAPAEGKIHILSEDIAKMQEELKYKSYAGRRVVFIEGADSIPAIGQNKLLKTLEEPIGDTVFVLYAERRDALLQTVLSRCTEIASSDKAPEIKDASASLAKAFYTKKNAGGLFFELKEILAPILNDKESSREMSLDFLDALENILREDLIHSYDSQRIGKQIMLTEEARKNIKSGFSVAIAMKALALNI